MADKRKRLMLECEIPAFVDDVIKTGCDICAIGHEFYTIGDADLPKEKIDNVTVELVRVMGKYGDRDHLILEFVVYLRSLGRYIDDAAVDHWSKNGQPN
ncbi:MULTISPECIES: hypothetical protein [unclassified Phyllobacterium]|uniref:hypothetical protein n=1 Tax=unclassified Phyllobacterium TaxID=2638441 RepID=UPI003012C514